MGGGILTMMTDFGLEGSYVAEMKGVVLGLVPDARIVDVTHLIAPQAIRQGAYVLSSVVDAFPAGTVHLAVVDPGVGTSRRLIAVSTVDRWFVLPDNGLVGEALRAHPPIGLWEIANPALRRASVSNTFHGRDVLAPAAAHLLLGRDPDELGPRLADYVLLPGLEPSRNDDGYFGEVIFIDAFGNLITNFDRTLLGEHSLEDWSIDVAGSRIAGLVTTYGHQSPGTLIALVGSSGRIEVAVVNGNAGRRLTVGVGTRVSLSRRGERTKS